MSRRPVLGAVAAVAVAAGMLGCGVQPTAPIYAGLAPGRLTSAGPYVYFIVAGVPRPLPVFAAPPPDKPSGPAAGSGAAAASPVPSDVGPTPDALIIGLTRLAQGPTTNEQAAGVRTDLPAGIQIRIRTRSDVSVVVTVTSATDRFGRNGMTQIVCTVTRATARLASGDKQLPPLWQYPHRITIVTPDGKQHTGEPCGKYLNAPPFTP